MLLQNPQLAYALLQAQVVMRIVDPQVAMTMLHRETGPTPAPMMVSVKGLNHSILSSFQFRRYLLRAWLLRK